MPDLLNAPMSQRLNSADSVSGEVGTPDLNAVAERLERRAKIATVWADAYAADKDVKRPETKDRRDNAADLLAAAECVRLIAQIRSGDEGMVETVARALFAWDYSESKAARDWPTLAQHKGAWLSQARAALRAIGGEG